MARGTNLKQVAAAAKVSTCTASKILSEHPDHHRYAEDTIARVRATAERLGYRVDPRGRALRTKRSDCIALLGLQGDSLLTARAFQATTAALQQAGLHGILVPGGGWKQQIANSLRLHRDGRCDGTLLLAWNLTASLCAPLIDAEIPTVVMEPGQDLGLPAVAIDHVAGCVMAVDHLCELGHRHLAWIGPAGRGHADGQRRRRAVQQAARKRGCRVDSIGVPMGRGPTVQSDIVAAVDTYLARSTVATGLICYHDDLALCALQCCLRRGIRVPEDCSIIGHDDSLARYGLPGLSSVGFGFERAAEQSVGILVEWLGGQPVPTDTRLIEPVLVERASCVSVTAS